MLVVLLPLTEATRGIINASLLSQLKQMGPLGGPILINAGRGGLQVEADILAALDSGALKGASLDVFEHEPLPKDSRLWSHPAVYVSPHNRGGLLAQGDRRASSPGRSRLTSAASRSPMWSTGAAAIEAGRVRRAREVLTLLRRYIFLQVSMVSGVQTSRPIVTGSGTDLPCVRSFRR